MRALFFVIGLAAVPLAAAAQDADRDLVADAADACPTEAETYDGTDDLDGCPEDGRISHVRVVDDELVPSERLRFEIEDETLRPESYALLDEVAWLLRAHPELGVVHVEGHMDPATWEERRYLSSRLWDDRAEAVVAYLVVHGVPIERLTEEGLVTNRPLCDSGSVPRRRRRACRRENDRIVLRLDRVP